MFTWTQNFASQTSAPQASLTPLLPLPRTLPTPQNTIQIMSHRLPYSQDFYNNGYGSMSTQLGTNLGN